MGVWGRQPPSAPPIEISNLIRYETEEEPAGFFGSGLAQGGLSSLGKEDFPKAGFFNHGLII